MYIISKSFEAFVVALAAGLLLGQILGSILGAIGVKMLPKAWKKEGL
jgi:hypothetical protein